MLWVLIRIASVAEANLMSTHNICFYGELTKIILQLSSNTHLICSTDTASDSFITEVTLKEINKQKYTYNKIKK